MKKIMFSDRYGLTQAVLEGRKTMTRRVIPARIANYIDWKAFEEGKPDCWCANSRDDAWRSPILAATYQPGEVVAVAQAYKDIEKEINRDGLPLLLKDRILKSPGYRNKMFVLAEDMPHQIRITNVRVERLQDISKQDCLREGIEQWTFDIYTFEGWKFFCHDPREAFAALIDKISGKGTWESNPWVFVYEFELVK